MIIFRGKHFRYLTGGDKVTCPQGEVVNVTFVSKIRKIFWLFVVFSCFQTGNLFAFNYGDRVQCNYTGMNIRSSTDTSSSANILASANSGDTGTVQGGPYTTTQNTYTWYYVAWNTHPTGYSIQNDLQLATASTPSITSVSPNPATGANSGQTLNIYGSGFVSGAQVKLAWPTVGSIPAGNATLSATFVSSSQLQVTATLGNDPETWTAQVINPGGISSATYNFSEQAPVPVITSLLPSSVTSGGSAFTLTVYGTTFNQSSVILWNGTSLSTSHTISSGLTTAIYASIPASYIASAGSATITVYTPSPGGGTSSGWTFTISGVTPTITSVSPNPATGANSGQTLNIYGSGFVSGAQVKLAWPTVGSIPAGNATLSATFVSSSQLQVTATLGNDPETWTAQVINPGGISSATYNFSEQAPVPVIQFLSPSSVATGGATFTLSVNGSTFDQGSIVYWNGVSLSTTRVASSGGLTTVLQATVPSSYIASAGTATVTVFNPSPGGGTSAGVSFNIGASSTTTSQGVDYSLNPPNLSALKAAGYGFVIRYVSAAGNAKNITSSEAQALQAAGLGIIIVFESTAKEMQNGYSAGVADANTAVTTATAAGAPANFFCYFACDFDAQPSDQTAINLYLDGAASVLGVSRVGFYGGYAPLKNVLDAGKATKGWQTTAWSSGNIDPRISLYQYLYNQTSAGGSYDIDEGFGSDLGQWSATPIDTTPPALTIGSPANNATVTSASLAVSGTASDSGLGNNGVSSVTVNGTSATGGTAAGTGTATWNATVTLVSGANTITVIAKDTLNNSTTKQITVTYNPPDVTPPTVAISSPSSGTSYTTAQTVNIIASASDNVGLSKVDFYDGSTLMGSNPMGPYAVSWSFTSANNGAHNWTARAYDTSGNVATSSVVSLTVAISPVAPTANAATALAITSFTANWSSASGATGYRLDVSTSSTFASYITGYQDLDVGNVASKSVTGLAANTTYYYRVRAYNTGGASGNSGTITVATTGGGGASSPPITSPKLSGAAFTISVPTQVGFSYTLEYKHSFSDASWTAVQTVSGTGGAIIMTDPGATDSSRLYHVRVQ